MSVTFEEFSAHCALLGHREPPLHAVDLYLTAACRLGRYAAVQVLDRDYILRSRALIQGLVRNASVVSDLLQDVRHRLLVGAGAKVGSYRGRGPLGSWIRSIALNVARDYIRTESARRRAEEAQAFSLVCGGSAVPLQLDDATLGILRGAGVEACSGAVREAFQSLPVHERELLRDHYLHGLSIDVLAPLCLVNRATVARRIRRSTDEVRRQVRKRLAALYPREDARSLDALALAACRDLIPDTDTLLQVPTASPEATSPLLQSA